MTLLEIRESIFHALDWRPASSELAKTRLNTFINETYQQLAVDLPWVFFQEEVPLVFYGDQVPRSATDTLTVNSTDAWVMMLTLVVGTSSTWKTDGSWGGRYIQLVDSSGRSHVHRIREVWQDQGPDGQPHFFFTLFEPWHTTPDTIDTWRVFDKGTPLPPGLIHIDSFQTEEDGEYQMGLVISEEEAVRRRYDDTPLDQEAATEFTRRCGFRRVVQNPMIAPTRKPGVAAHGSNNWLTTGVTRPAGEFQYAYTYALGIEDAEHQTYQGGTLPRGMIPRWESRMSPASSSIISTNGGRLNVVTLPDIGMIQGFGDSGTTRYRHSGWKKRIWVRRKTIDTTSAAQPNAAEVSDQWLLLAQVDAHVTTYDDNGSVFPEYHYRARQTNFVETWQIWPRPAEATKVRGILRGLRSPVPLLDDGDTPSVDHVAYEAILAGAKARAFGMLGNSGMVGKWENAYREVVKKITKSRAFLQRQTRPTPIQGPAWGTPPVKLPEGRYNG